MYRGRVDVGRRSPDVGAEDDQRGPFVTGGLAECGLDRPGVVGHLTQVDHVPAVGLESCWSTVGQG